MPKRGHRRSRRADSRGHDERGTCTPRTIKPTPASRITLRGASHTRRLTLPPCSCPPEPLGTRAPAEMRECTHAASPRSSPPSTSNHGPTAHESRRGGVAWLGQAVRWSGSGAGPTGCHQASGGGCSGLPQPIMNSGCGAAWLAGNRRQDQCTFLFRSLPLLLRGAAHPPRRRPSIFRSALWLWHSALSGLSAPAA